MAEFVNGCIKLGFGLMRLPRVEGTNEIDIEHTSKMVDEFIAKGGKYFDTAYIYDGSEEATRKALCERHDRSEYYIASKLNCADFCCKSEEEALNEINISLSRLGIDYLDYYLLHSLEEGNKEKYEKYNLWNYVKELKEKGLIKHWGFSFHDSPELLDTLLTEHPDAEFVQLQINYADWNDPIVRSRECYEVAVKHNVPIVVMEPVKGGTLANPVDQVRELLASEDKDATPAQWAVRFVASLPGVEMVLSGMSNMEQMNDNLSYMADFKPMTDEEFKTIDKAREILDSLDTIKCTACRYCTPGCPMDIHIPDIFSVMNLYKIHGNLAGAKGEYSWRPGGAKASACVECGQCEEACPQHLPIMSFLKEVAETLE